MLVDYLIMGGWTSCRIMVGDITDVAFFLIDDDVDQFGVVHFILLEIKERSFILASMMGTGN